MEIPLSTIISDAEIATETAMTMGLPWMVGALEVPPPSAGALIALDALKSPFVSGSEFEIKDFFIALYCIYDSEQACKDIFASQKMLEMYERLKLEKFLDKHIELENKINDKAVDLISEVEDFNYIAEVQNLMQYIKLSMAGFEMIESEKKTKEH